MNIIKYIPRAIGYAIGLSLLATLLVLALKFLAWAIQLNIYPCG